MQQAHFVIREVSMALEHGVDMPEAMHAFVTQLESADRPDAGYPPYLPSGIECGAQFGMRHSGCRLEHAVAHDHDARLAAGVPTPWHWQVPAGPGGGSTRSMFNPTGTRPRLPPQALGSRLPGEGGPIMIMMGGRLQLKLG